MIHSPIHYVVEYDLLIMARADDLLPQDYYISHPQLCLNVRESWG